MPAPETGRRVAVIADLLEERWPSMDLMAEMLLQHVAGSEAGFDPVLFRPSFSRFVPRSGSATVPIFERILHRFWSYPRWLRRQAPADIYHIVDHSYAHLVHALPAERVVVTCHDSDAFRGLLGGRERESSLPGVFTRRILSGLRRAAAVVSVSEATRNELVREALVEPDRITVAPNAVHPAFSAAPDADADEAAAVLTGPAGGADLLHVGSAIPRKRLDVLLRVLALVAETRPDVRLWRVGPLSHEQMHLARELGVGDRIVVMPFLSRSVLAAVYRRAGLVLLPSEREGFGLPVVEAMACGTPIVCSDIAVLREVGGDAAEYCAVGEAPAWSARIIELLAERDADHARWTARRMRCVSRSKAFSWERYAIAMQRIYTDVAGDVARERDR